jgi:hypothetical protein
VTFQEPKGPGLIRTSHDRQFFRQELRRLEKDRGELDAELAVLSGMKTWLEGTVDLSMLQEWQPPTTQWPQAIQFRRQLEGRATVVFCFKPSCAALHTPTSL